MSLFFLKNVCSFLSWDRKSCPSHTLIPFFSIAKDTVWLRPSAAPAWLVHGNGLHNAPRVTRLSLSPTAHKKKPNLIMWCPRPFTEQLLLICSPLTATYHPSYSAAAPSFVLLPVAILSFSHVASEQSLSGMPLPFLPPVSSSSFKILLKSPWLLTPSPATQVLCTFTWFNNICAIDYESLRTHSTPFFEICLSPKDMAFPK